MGQSPPCPGWFGPMTSLRLVLARYPIMSIHSWISELEFTLYFGRFGFNSLLQLLISINGVTMAQQGNIGIQETSILIIFSLLRTLMGSSTMSSLSVLPLQDLFIKWLHLQSGSLHRVPAKTLCPILSANCVSLMLPSRPVAEPTTNCATWIPVAQISGVPKPG